jgi:uncharacterized protein (DUF58 family)
MKKRLIADLFIDNRWYLLMSIGIFLFIIAFFIHFLLFVALIYLLVFAVLSVMDYLMLFIGKRSVLAQRIVNERLNLGFDNTISLSVRNSFPFPVSVRLIDELPVQFQERSFSKYLKIPASGRQVQEYILKPVTRGEYFFERILCYVRSPLGLLQRRCISEASQMVKVYPATKFLRQYQLLALSDSNQYAGSKKNKEDRPQHGV